MKLIYMVFGIVFLFLITGINADPWVDDPNNCPTTWQAQTCSGSDVVCGFDSGVTYCYDPASLSPPSINTSSNTDWNTSFDGGHLINCIDYDGSAPHCDNSAAFWCDRNSTCYTTQQRNTNCTADSWGASVCNLCRSGYYNCYGDIVCEATSTSDCNATAVDNTRYDTATCETDPSQPGTGDCECDPNYFPCDGGTPSAPVLDADGCEHLSGASCSSGTGTKVYNQCYDSSNANCTSATNSDCDDDDSDGFRGTCNGANGCEIISGASCGSGTGTYASAQCVGAGGNCTRSGDNLDCDDDDGDSNLLTCNGANGCEVDDGGSCSVGALAGTYSGCTCVVDKSYFETGTKIDYQTNSSQLGMLWFQDYYSSATLINATNWQNESWILNATGCVTWMDGTVQCGNYFTGNITFYDNITFSENLTLTGYISCNLETDASGNLVCGTDDVGGGVSKNASGPYLYNDTTTIYFNETVLNATIDDKIASVTYLPYNVTVVYGTIDAGNLTSILVPEDNDTLNISEIGGVNALEVIINFTGVTDFNSIIFRLRYMGGLGHEIVIGLYNFNTSSYEEEYGDITDQAILEYKKIDVFDAAVHINETNVSLRFRHEQPGNLNHDLFLDYVSLVDGFSTITNTEHDAMSGRDNIENHPWALPINGSRVMTGDLNMSLNNINNATLINSTDFYCVSCIESTMLVDTYLTSETDPHWSGNYSGYNKSQWDDAYEYVTNSSFVNRSGDTMTGDLLMAPNNEIFLRSTSQAVYSEGAGVLDLLGGVAIKFNLGGNIEHTMSGTTFTVGGQTADRDYQIQMKGESNIGFIQWMEDEDYFLIKDDLFMDSGENINITTGDLIIGSLTNCDTINTTSTGLLVCGNDATAAGGASKNASGPYLYNDTTTIYFNETVLNNTIDNRENDSYPGDVFVNTTGDVMTGDLNITGANNLFVNGTAFYVNGSEGIIGLNKVPEAAIDVIYDGSMLTMARYSNVQAGAIFLAARRARGTEAVPLAPIDDDYVGQYGFNGWSANAGAWKNTARVQVRIDGTPDSGADPTDMPGEISLQTTGEGSGTPTLRQRIASNGEIFMPAVYSDTLSAPTRDLYIRNDGQIGYLSSSIIHKENIKNVTDTDWIYDLRVVDFDFKEGALNQTGLIAEEADLIEPRIVSYKINTTYKTIGKGETETIVIDKIEETDIPETINYGSPIMISSMIKEIQNLKAEIEILKTTCLL